MELGCGAGNIGEVGGPLGQGRAGQGRTSQARQQGRPQPHGVSHDCIHVTFLSEDGLMIHISQNCSENRSRVETFTKCKMR